MSRETLEERTIKNLMPKHPYVFAWHKILGSHDYYIADQLISAQRDNAPTSAIYLKEDGEWANMIGLETSTIELLQELIPAEYIPVFEDKENDNKFSNTS